MIGIVDYGMGNLRSLRNALAHVGIDAEIVTDAPGIERSERLILPGVGAFGRAMENINARQLAPPIRAHADAGKPLLGICLGMQLLASKSLEFGENAGLGLIPGEVVPLPDDAAHPVPHVGWNDVRLTRPHAAFEGTKKNVDYYFVHSFHFRPVSGDDALGVTEYGAPFTSVVARGNVLGCQFHPEKSQASGLAILERFSSWSGKA
jgi:glutamine amidotransferase